MPITVNANRASTPPQMEVTIASPDGSAMSAITLYRAASGVRTLTRVQPSTGVASRYIEDPEAPWDTDVVYSAAITYGGGSSTLTASAAQLNPSAFWAVHPLVPGRSMALDVQDFAFAGIASIGELTRKAQANQHDILGGSLPVVTRMGNRKAAAGQLEITTVSDWERLRLAALLDDENPVLLRCPAAWGWGWDNGYYSIGDTGEARRLQYGPDSSRTIRLPFQKVAAPAGVQQSSWGWGDLLAKYADWGSVAAAYADWNAVAGNNPG
jgi:hypothetical protein